MGILDHQRTWHFETVAGTDECEAAFAAALSGKSELSLKKARWSMARQGDSFIATYQGRAGMLKAATFLSRRATQEENAAVGSQLTFQIHASEADGRRTACSMWLNRVSTMWIFFTADARFLRGYMNEVARRFRRLDPTVSIVKS
jgi:hypothetical protein